MTCEEAMERLADRLTGDLDTVAARALREHLAACEGCAAEAAALQSLWAELDAPAEETPTPTPALRRRFDAMLRREIAKAGSLAGAPALPPAFPPRPTPDRRGSAASPAMKRSSRGSDPSLRRAAYGMALAAGLAVSLGAGIYLGSRSASLERAEDVAALRDEIRSLRSTVTLALLAESSPSERLSGVAHGRELQSEDRRIADALFETLQQDPNINVRLAALDALREIATRPDTRARLLASIPEQDSPLVQLSAIDVVLESGGAGGRDELARLSDDAGLDTVVRGYLLGRLERSPR